MKKNNFLNRIREEISPATRKKVELSVLQSKIEYCWELAFEQGYDTAEMLWEFEFIAIALGNFEDAEEICDNCLKVLTKNLKS